MGLSARQERFAREYARGGNGAQAYAAAGYKAKSAEVASKCANKLLKNAEVRALVDSLLERARSEAVADVRELQEFLTGVVRGEPSERKVVSTEAPDGSVTRATTVQRPRVADRVRAAETLGKMLGAFDQQVRVELSVPLFEGEADLEG